MKHITWGIAVVLWFVPATVPGQEIPDYRDASVPMENLAERNQADITDDSRELDVDFYRRHPLNLNSACREDLALLEGLSPVQIDNLIEYRKLLGDLVSIHELQAVPGWDLETIHRLLPTIYVGREESLSAAVRDRWRKGDQALLVRTTQTMERSEGYRRDSAGYLGSPQKLFFRYSYNYRQLLQYGLSGEKDPGERFFRGAQRYGFDFYSFHFFLQRAGLVRALAIGDFTVNLGQGLLSWQTIAFDRGGGVAAIKRQAPVLRPYHSAGEFNFHRGAGITLAKGKWELTVFASRQAISTHPGSDTLNGNDVFTAFQNGGYHRTALENATRNNNRQTSVGGNLTWRRGVAEIGINGIFYHFSASLEPRDAPYNRFAFRGRDVGGASVHYGYTYRNWHIFGEAAMDATGHPAIIQGLIGSLAPDLDAGFLYRNISRAYHSLYADAFTEYSGPVNEQGLYGVLSYGPRHGWKTEMYYDLFRSPWLRYRADAPTSGTRWNWSGSFQPGKKWSMGFAYRGDARAIDGTTSQNGVHTLQQPVHQRLSLETKYYLSSALALRIRMESIWIRKDPDFPRLSNQGFLNFLEIIYHNKIINGNCRIQRFSIPGYDARIYISESDMLYNFALPAYYGEGWNYYFNLNRTVFHKRDKSRAIKIWLRWSQSIFPGKAFTGSGLDRIPGSRTSRIGVQVIYNW